MTETSTTATLVGTPEMFAARSNVLTATIPRDQIEEALTSEPPAELILDVVRNQGTEAERRTVNVAWTQADLESLLDLPGAEAVTFYFDPEELERVLDDADVEAHGLKEAAVVLSIAAVAPAGTAGSAFGHPPDVGWSSEGSSTVVAAHDEASLADRGIVVQGVAAHDESTLAGRGIEAEPLAATHDEASLAARGIEAEPLAATHDEANLVARGIEPLPGVKDEATMSSRGIEAQPLPAVHDEATVVARGIVDETPAVAGDTGSGFEVPSVDPATAAALAGGLAGAGLLIAAAAFATRRRELGHP